jgi:trafficking protein particle complex subunit 13
MYKATSLNWDLDPDTGKERDAVNPVLMAREVIQVAFLLEQRDGEQERVEEGRKDQLGDIKRALGQLSIQWRTALGDRGTLSTGWLTARR